VNALMTPHHPGNVETRIYREDEVTVSEPICAAIFRRSRHRQSSPSTGIGSRAVSSAHQHGPAGRQVNSVPQAEHARRRDTEFSNRFVMKRTKPWPVF
jgi:hypothetical protein